MKKAIALALMAAFLAPVMSCAQKGYAADKDFETRLDNYVRATLEKLPDIPAISIVVVKGDKPIFTHAYGMADREAGVNADKDTLVYIASSTKAYTALAASLYDREGKIKLDDPFIKYTKGVQFANAIPEKVTIRNLLTHTSGLQNFALVHRMAFTGLIDPKEMSTVFAKGMTFTEGRFGKYNYDNLGYNIYAVLLQNNLGLKWQDALQQRVFDPLGLKHTTSYVSRAESKKWKLAAPYVFDAVSGKVVRSVLPKTDNTMQSAGGIFSSISDIGRWLNVNMNDGRIDGKQVFPADIMRAAHTGYTTTVRNEPPFTGEGEYGLGWQIGKYRQEKVIYHFGGYAGYNNHFSYMPDKKIAVGIAVNTSGIGRTVMQMIASYVYDSLLGVENVEADYAKRLNDIAAEYSTRKGQAITAAGERAKRTWQLSKPFRDYAGRYTNELFGTIEITALENALAVRWGNMNCVATPFTQKETIRVELEPGGSGEIMKFGIDANGIPGTLDYNGITFTRVR
ncbi:MAG TPA: serine hydrolase domain-containing protein [Pyrinomonadaceae bacterium]|nr:serine hydrolase domain-containing protein [Pyrinomonadaceae bacterium]